MSRLFGGVVSGAVLAICIRADIFGYAGFGHWFGLGLGLVSLASLAAWTLTEAKQ